MASRKPAGASRRRQGQRLTRLVAEAAVLGALVVAPRRVRSSRSRGRRRDGAAQGGGARQRPESRRTPRRTGCRPRPSGSAPGPGAQHHSTRHGSRGVRLLARRNGVPKPGRRRQRSPPPIGSLLVAHGSSAVRPPRPCAFARLPKKGRSCGCAQFMSTCQDSVLRALISSDRVTREDLCARVEHNAAASPLGQGIGALSNPGGSGLDSRSTRPPSEASSCAPV